MRLEKEKRRFPTNMCKASTACILDTPVILDKLMICTSINQWLSMMIYIIIDRSLGWEFEQLIY